MKKYCVPFICSLLTFSVIVSASGQGFMNLDFEDANLPISPAPAYPTPVSFADAFPGWTGYIGTNQATQAFNNGVSAGSSLITLITRNTGTLTLSNYVIGGFYTAVISSGEDPANSSSILPAALAQTGLVPVGTRSLIFSFGSFGQIDGLNVTFNGQNLGLVALFAGLNYEAYGADISAFAGTTGELRFTEQPTSFPFNNAYLDDIQFSTQSIPEPGEFALAALGALLFGFRRWRNSTR